MTPRLAREEAVAAEFQHSPSHLACFFLHRIRSASSAANGGLPLENHPPTHFNRLKNQPNAHARAMLVIKA